VCPSKNQTASAPDFSEVASGRGNLVAETRHKTDDIAALPLLLLSALAGASAELDSVSLDGDWQLTLDKATPDAQGLTWWSKPQPLAEPSFNRSNATIRVPGLSVGAAGFGDSNGGRKHVYTGSVWYTKQLHLPAAWKTALQASSSVVISFGGVFRSMQLFVNGQAAGSHFGYMEPFSLDISPHARSAMTGGVAVLNVTARVSGGNNFSVGASGDGLNGCFDLNDGLGGWMGIWGNVSVKLQHGQLSASDLHIRLLEHTPISDSLLGETSADISVTGTLGEHSYAMAEAVVLSCVIHEHDPERGKSGAPLVEIEARLDSFMDIPHGKSAGRFKVLLTMPRARLWGPSSPVLYHATVTLRSAVDGTLLDTVTDRFGVRTLDIDGPYFVLNGARHFLISGSHTELSSSTTRSRLCHTLQ
jgi:hypothetical protein